MLTIDLQLIDTKDGELVLDIGCGEGRHTWEVCKQSRCCAYGVDIDEESLKKAFYTLYLLDTKGETKGHWALLRADITHLPFKDKVFHKIVCSEVLEHVKDDTTAIRELVRVLKDNGIIAVSVPSYLPESICWMISRNYYDHPGGHIRIYKTKELVDKLEQNKLRVYAVRRKHALHSFYWILRCIFGVNNNRAFLPALYYKFLVWDIYKSPKLVRVLETVLDRFFSKSLVVYAYKVNQGY